MTAPLLSACLIVKNEAAVLERCLRSVTTVADEIVVVDTGSTDDTIAIAKRMGAAVYNFAWINDYAAARNMSLAHATGAFILYIDADEELHADDAAPLRALLESGETDAVQLQIESLLPGGQVNVARYLRVFRNYPGVHFVHPIHEQIWPALAEHQPRVVASHFRIVHHGYNQSEEALKMKCQRNLDGALAVLAREPDNAFYLYHAGLGHLTLQEPDKALPWLERAERLAAREELGPILNALAQAHYDTRRHDAAEAVLRRSVKHEPEQHHGWALLADLLLLNSRHAEAIRALDGALAAKTSRLHTDVSQNRAVLHMKRGMCALLTHDAEVAIAQLEQAIAIGLATDELATANRYLAMAQRMVAAN